MPVAVLNRNACSQVEDFVRDALGCTCPPGVFGDVRLETDPAGFPDMPGSRLLAIGGRLLVLLVDADTALAAPQIRALLQRGRELRDAGGFNRFRLVIATPQEGGATAPAATDPDSVVTGDDRLHLHCIARSRLPDRLHTPAEVQ